MARMTDIERYHAGVIKDLQARERQLEKAIDLLRDRLDEIWNVRSRLESNPPPPPKRRKS